MATKLTDEEKRVGAANFNQAAADLAAKKLAEDQAAGKTDRRTFIKAVTAAGAVLPVSAAVYFGYESWKGNKAVKAALIGAGDEGGVLIGEHNPEYLDFVSVCDLRPTNLKRIIDGEPAGPRKGFNKLYGKDKAAKIKTYDDYKQLIAEAKDRGVEAVVIATPLFTHKDIAIDCMKAGLHVLCEKLMARDIKSCKEMIAAAKQYGVLLSVGHQRHYSLLYAHAREVVDSGILGEIKHIRALWHRNNSWPFTATDDAKKTYATGKDIDGTEFDLPALIDGWCKPVPKADADGFLKNPESLKKWGFKSITELVRWRLYDRTGGGLMAELGSHQLDAASIFLGKVHPLAVSGVGGKFFYGPGKNDRESNDGVFTTFEFPGANHPRGVNKGKDENDVVVVTYSSFNTNEFEDYGECLMGSRGTMLVEKEANVYLFKEKDKTKKGEKSPKDTAVKVTAEGGKGPAMEAASTWGGGGAAITKNAAGNEWDTEVRGYRTEMEHFAYCVRRWQDLKQKVSYEEVDGKLKYADILPKCHGEVAMADAILALTANMAMAKRQRIEFDPKWFEPDATEVPETKWA
jgi:predicted dehydrogenase